MPFVSIHDNAKRDLIKIREDNPKAFSKIMAVLEQVESDPLLQERLLEPKQCIDNIETMRWCEQFRQGNNLYRIKAWSPEDNKLIPYRIIYAYFIPPNHEDYVVLGVVPREDFNYEPTNVYTKRILKDYGDIL